MDDYNVEINKMLDKLQILEKENFNYFQKLDKK